MVQSTQAVGRNCGQGLTVNATGVFVPIAIHNGLSLKVLVIESFYHYASKVCFWINDLNETLFNVNFL